jgi:hypothetical protein
MSGVGAQLRLAEVGSGWSLRPGVTRPTHARSMSCCARLWTLCAGLLLLTGCALGAHERERHADAPATSWHYEITLDEALTRVDARVCFHGVVPRELRAGKDEAAAHLSYARWLGPGAVRRLKVQRGRIQLLEDTRDGCVAYGVDLRETGSLDAAVRRIGRDVLASPNVWLWRPERRATEAVATIALKLPPKHSALLPWPERDGLRVLDAEAFRFDSYAAFGRFERILGREGNVDIEAAVVAGKLAVDRDAVLRWLRASVRVAALSDGQFPRERLTAIVVPTPANADPVLFGMVARGGGASVLLLVNDHSPEAALRSDWVLPHELSHLLLPFVDRGQAWLSEGLATYYQEVLLARAGTISERVALSRIARSLRSAAAEDPGGSVIALQPATQATYDFRKIYWGGASYWLNVDVELRRRSSGHVTVDSVLTKLRERDRQRGVWTMRAMIDALDALAGTPVFSFVLEKAQHEEFPAFEQVLSDLGVRGQGESIELDDAAALAGIRRAIFTPP